jgi:enoyl-[acyl-carrier protein] reductase II
MIPHHVKDSPIIGQMQRGCEFLGCDIAILGGAMSWISERNLVSALSNAGAFGVIAGGSMSPDLLCAEIIATQALTQKPFGVNLIVMHPQLMELADVCIQTGVSHVVLAGGLPKNTVVSHLTQAGVKVLSFAPTLAFGRKLVRGGVNALIIEGSEAGGHIGSVSTSVLAQEILPEITEVPVFVAGGIGRGEIIASYLKMGAAGVQLGTKFVCAEESIAHPRFKQLFVQSDARHAVPSVQVDPDFPVTPVRAIENKATQHFIRVQQEAIRKYREGLIDKQAAQLEIEHFWAGALRRAVIDGEVEMGSVMAGQSVGMVKQVQPIREILDELLQQAATASTLSKE